MTVCATGAIFMGKRAAMVAGAADGSAAPQAAGLEPPAASALHGRRVVGLIAAGLVFIIVMFALHRLAGEISYDEVRAALRQMGTLPLLLSIAATAGSYFALTFYDVSALAYAGERPRYRDVAIVAFCAYAVGNTAGFGPLSGGAIRYRFYSRLGLEPQAIARVIGFVTVAFGIGLAAVSLLAAFVAAPQLAPVLDVPEATLRYGSLAALVVAATLLAVATRRGSISVGRWSIRMPKPRLAAGSFWSPPST